MPAQVRWQHLWFPLLVLLVVQVLLVWQGRDMLAGQGLRDTDTYMRLVRVEELAAGGGWFDRTVERANAPYGDTLHWTRPLDVLLLAGAAPLMPIVGAKAALYWWGVLLSPVLHWAFLAILIWAGAALVRSEQLVYVGILAVTQPALLGYFLPARPDHHSLIAVLFAVMLGCTLRLLTPAGTRRLAALAGAAGGLAIWVSVEALVAVALAIAVLGAAWLAGRRVGAASLATFCATVLAVIACALPIEQGVSGLLAAEYDRVSIVHALLLALLTAFWTVAAWFDGRSGQRQGAAARIALCAAGAAGGIGILLATYPDLLRGPTETIDPRVMDIWFAKVNEVSPMVSRDDWGRGLGRLSTMLGPVLLALPYSLWRWRCEPERRWLWTCILAALAVFVPLSLMQVRWATYAEAVVVLPYAVLLGDLLAWLQGRVRSSARGMRLGLAVVRAEVVVVFAAAFMVVPAIFEAAPADAGNGKTHRCDLAMAMDQLRAVDGGQGSNLRIMTSLFFGPELLYRTPHSVVGTPYHRNARGILDTYDFFRASDDTVARRIIADRGINVVMVCTAPGEASFYRQDGVEIDEILHQQLVDGRIPDWLREVPPPEDQAASPFRVFRVVPQTSG